MLHNHLLHFCGICGDIFFFTPDVANLHFPYFFPGGFLLFSYLIFEFVNFLHFYYLTVFY